MAAQALSGVAKDLTKMSSKSAIKVLVPAGEEGRGALFRWVAILTGSKNALKGVGFFLGGFLLSVAGFAGALWAMAAGLALMLAGAWAVLPPAMGKAKQKAGWRELFAKSRPVNVLSAARFFLFGSRDVWFVVALPVFLRQTLGWSFYQVGGFLACWVIGYGIIQFLAPTLMQRFGSGRPPQSQTIRFWTFTLTAVPGAIALALQLGLPANIVIISGLLVFGVVFAFNSAVHSYLVLAFTDDDKVALNVGFYYMANSGGRLVGTVLSGLVYQIFGLVGCLWTSMFFVFAAGLVSLKLPNPQPSKAIAWKAGDGE
jgi:predicted MFS family arabinose efflux permease